MQTTELIRRVDEGHQIPFVVSTAAQEWTINTDAYHARRKVSNWLARDVAMLLMGHAVTLVLAEPPYWRVSVVLTSRNGIRGEVGTVDVDADTCEMMLTPELADNLLGAATTLANEQTAAV